MPGRVLLHLSSHIVPSLAPDFTQRILARAGRRKLEHGIKQSLAPTFTSALPSQKLKRQFNPRLSCTGTRHLHFVRAASSNMSSPSRVVEHVVFFKVKEGVPPEQAEAMVTALRRLKSLDCVLLLTVGPALQVWSESYTHALHCRYKDKDALAAYASHPAHLDVVNNFVSPIVEDRLALDWEADVEETDPEYGAVRIAVLKTKADLPEGEVSGITDLLKGYKNLFPLIKQVTAGNNFSHARAKGFNLGFVALFPSVKELEELTKNEEHVNIQYTKVRPLMENFAVVDYSTS